MRAWAASAFWASFRSSAFSSVSLVRTSRRSMAALVDFTVSTMNAAAMTAASGFTSRAGSLWSSRSMGGWITYTIKSEKKPQARELVRQM